MKKTTGKAPAAAAPVAVNLIAVAALLLAVGALIPATIMRNGIYQNSVKVWQSMAEGSPNKRRPHQNYGQALSTAGDLQKALEEFKKVLELDDDSSVPMRDTYREIGVVYFRLGLFDEAIQAWKKGLNYAPFDSGLMNNLAIALMKLNRLDEALSYAETAVRHNESMAEPANTLGELYLAKGNPKKAAEYFKKYVYLRPEDSRGYWNAALALKDAGDFQGSYELVSQFLAREGDPRYRQNALQLSEYLKKRMQQGR